MRPSDNAEEEALRTTQWQRGARQRSGSMGEVAQRSKGQRGTEGQRSIGGPEGV